MKQRVLTKIASFHPLFIKKKGSPKRCRFNGTWVFFFPWTCEVGEEEDFSPLLCPLPLSLKPPKRCRQNSSLARHMVDEEGMHP